MEEEVCMFSKFGYCRYKEQCRRRHYREICIENENCKARMECPKRHPKKCKKYRTEKGCRFGSDCSYEHTIQHVSTKANETQENLILKNKVVLLEASLKDLENKMCIIQEEKI